VVLALTVGVLLLSLLRYMHSPYGHGDIDLYRRYALDFWTGVPPFRSLPAEYPMLALAPFTLTLLPPVSDYVTVFGLWMLLLMAAGYVALRHRESARTAEVCAVYLVLGCFATVLGRYDLVPAATVVVACWAARQRRFELAYALLALGALLKLYPVVLLPVVAIEQYRALGAHPLRLPPPHAVVRGLVIFAVLVAAGFALAFALDPDNWLGPFTFNARRPLQVESVPATLLWLTGFAGLPVAADRSFNSYNLLGRASELIGVAADLSLVGGCLLVYWRQLNGRLGFGRALGLCVLVVLCTDRVLSPQYFIWALPLVAIAERDYDLVWLAVCALTTLIFPFAYDSTGLAGQPMPPEYPLYFPALIAVRNALLVVATVRFATRPARRPAPAPAPQPVPSWRG
jgi:Glycosyltransferase family 87